MLTIRSYLSIFFTPLLIISIASHTFFSYAQKRYEENSSNQVRPEMDIHHHDSPFLLKFLYNNFFGILIRKSLTHKWFSVLAGWYCDRTVSKYHIDPFVKQHSIMLDEAENQQFSSFNDFFIRKLKPESRPIDSHNQHLISPADGKVLILEKSTKTMKFPVKHSDFSLEQFLGSSELAKVFEGGTIMIFRLAPHDYHRFHFPLDCVPLEAQVIHGRYESVNPIVYLTGVQALTENERHFTPLLTRRCGIVALVSVGALCVGKIIETYQPYTWHKKGAEAGYFCFGGSTLVLIFKKDTLEIDPTILKNSQEGKETAILMGQKVALIIN